MAIQLSKRLFDLAWKKQKLSFQKFQQRFQVFAWLPFGQFLSSTETSMSRMLNNVKHPAIYKELLRLLRIVGDDQMAFPKTADSMAHDPKQA